MFVSGILSMKMFPCALMWTQLELNKPTQPLVDVHVWFGQCVLYVLVFVFGNVFVYGYVCMCACVH